MDHVIGVDIGTQSTKALLVRADGTLVAQHTKSYQPDTPRPSWAEQWPQVWLDAVAECLAGCVRKATEVNSGQPLAPEHIRAVCISSLYGGSGIPVDEAMQPLHPCLIWMDRRAEAEVRKIRDTVDVERLQAITGNGVDSYYGFTKMLWLRDHRPDVWARTRFFLPPNAYVIHALTGEIAVDHSSAGNIGGIYDIERRSWSAEMLDRLGIPARMMPPRLVASTDRVGGLSADWAERTGLLADTPIIAGGVDAAVATYAAGVVGPGQHVAMIGTSMCWGYLSPAPAQGLVCMPYVTRARDDLYVFGGASTAGACVSWYRDQLCQGAVAAAEALGKDPHAVLDAEAALVQPGAEGLVFLPYLMGERSPVWDGRASGAFIGLSLVHGRAHLYRAVLEGVAFALRHNIEAGRQAAAALDDRLVVVGGAAFSDLWMQIIADVTGYPVFTIKENVEAALCAARLAALGVGLIERHGEDDWITLVRRAEPDPVRRPLYDAAFGIYVDLYPALKDAMHRLAAIR